jgi:hypothetical protein
LDLRHIKQILAAGTDVYGELMNLCVWAQLPQTRLMVTYPTRSRLTLEESALEFFMTLPRRIHEF